MKKKFFLHALILLMVFSCASTAFATDFTGMTGTWKWKVVSAVQYRADATPIPSVGTEYEQEITQSGDSYLFTYEDGQIQTYSVSGDILVSFEEYATREEIIYDSSSRTMTYHDYEYNSGHAYTLMRTIVFERVSSSDTTDNEQETVSTPTDFTGMAGTWKVLSAVRDNYDVENGNLKSTGSIDSVPVGDTFKLKVTQSGSSCSVTTNDDEPEVYTVEDDKLVVRYYAQSRLGGKEEIIYDAPNHVTINEYEYYPGNGNLSWLETIEAERVTASTETETPQTVEIKTGDITNLSTKSQDALVKTLKDSGLTITSSKDIVLSSDTTVTEKTSYTAPSSSVTQKIETDNFKISTIALLPKITIDSDATNATNGSKLLWFSASISTPSSLIGKAVSAVKICLVEGILTSVGSVNTATAGDVTNAVILDEKNQPVSGTIPDKIVLAANVDAGQTYDLYAATATSSTTNNPEEDDDNETNSSGAGCNAGFGILGFLILAAALKLKK